MVQEIVTTFVGLFTGFLGGIATAVVDAFSTLFIDSSGTTDTITTFGIILLAFFCIGLALSLFYFIVNKIRG